MTRVVDIISRIIIDHLGLKSSDLNLHSDIINDLKGDSLDFAEIIAQIEQEFDIFIPDIDVEKIKIVMDIYKIVMYYLIKKQVESLDDDNMREHVNNSSSINFIDDIVFLNKLENKFHLSNLDSSFIKQSILLTMESANDK